jgi:putative transposase
MGERQSTDLVVAALVMALGRRRPSTELIHHSDHGSQGGFNWSPIRALPSSRSSVMSSSQHLDLGGARWQAGWVDEGADRAVVDEVAWSAIASP